MRDKMAAVYPLRWFVSRIIEIAPSAMTTFTIGHTIRDTMLPTNSPDPSAVDVSMARIRPIWPGSDAIMSNTVNDERTSRIMAGTSSGLSDEFGLACDAGETYEFVFGGSGKRLLLMLTDLDSGWNDDQCLTWPAMALYDEILAGLRPRGNRMDAGQANCKNGNRMPSG